MNLIKIAHHRNGISGIPFNVGIVEDKVDDISRTLLIVQFEDNPLNTAVFDLDMLKKDIIKFGINSWRGDHFHEKFNHLAEEYYNDCT